MIRRVEYSIKKVEGKGKVSDQCELKKYQFFKNMFAVVITDNHC